MFKRNYEKMTNEELRSLAQKHGLVGFMEKAIVFTEDRKIDTDFVVNRKEVIEQLSQRDNRNFTFWTFVVAVVSLIVIAEPLFEGYFKNKL